MKRIIYTLLTIMLTTGAWAQNVAKIGTTEYATLAEAVAAVTDGQTITVTADCSISSEILIDKSVNIDLNGKKVTTNSCSAFQVKGGKLNLTGLEGSKIVGTPANYKLIYLYGSADATASEYSVVNVGKNVTVDCTNGYAVMLSANGNSGYGVKVNIDGTATGEYGGLYVNGNITKSEGNVPVFTVGENAQIISTNGTAIYAAGYAEWSIAGNVTGKDTGIEIRAGKLDVTKGTIIGNGEVTNANPNGNGTTAVGAGIAVAQHTTKLPINVKVSGGEIKGYTAFYQIDAQSNGEDALSKISFDITGGMFTTINGGTNAIYSENKSGFVSGGTFNAPVPEGYCTSGFVVQDNGDGTYGVERFYAAQIGDTKYETLAEAITAATEGQTVTLLEDITDNITISAEKNITLDLNGKTLSGGSVASNGKNAAILNKGIIIIMDSSAENTGTIKRDDPENYDQSNSYYVIDNQGTMTIKSGTITNNAGLIGSHKGSSLIRNGEISEGAVLNIEGGTLTQNNFDVIKNGGNNSVLNITGGTINSSSSYAILSYDKVNMSAGTVTGKVCLRSYDSDNAVANISGGTINGNITVETYPGNTPSKLSECNISGDAIINGNLCVGEGNGNTFTANDENGTIAVSGGTFNYAVPEKYCADGFIPEDNGDGTYGVKEGSYTAKIGEQGYETLNDAITAANGAGKDVTITLLADATATEEPAANVTIDADGKAITLPTYNVADNAALAYAKVTNATNDTYKVTTATYSRTGADGTQWGTVCLPFSFETAPDGYTLYTPTAVGDNVLTVTEVEYPVAAGTPVIFYKSSAAATTMTMTSSNASVKTNAAPVAQSGSLALVGTFSQQKIESGLSNIYFINGNKFHQAKASLTVPAYRAYINYTSTGAKPSILTMFIGDNEATAVENIAAEDMTITSIYNANGQLLAAPQKGLNIINRADGKTVKLIIK